MSEENCVWFCFEKRNSSNQLHFMCSDFHLLHSSFHLELLTFGSCLKYSWMENRGLYALYTPVISRILVVVVNPFNNREIAIAQLERQFRDAVRNQSQSNIDTSELTCKVRTQLIKIQGIVFVLEFSEINIMIFMMLEWCVENIQTSTGCTTLIV